MTFCEVCLQRRGGFSSQSYTYLVPEEMENIIKPGMRVRVPFGRGNRAELGIVIAFKSNVDFETKEVSEILDQDPILDEEALAIFYHMVDKDLSDMGAALKPLLPPGSISKISTLYLAKDFGGDDPLLSFLNEERNYSDIKKKFGNEYSLEDMRRMEKEGRLEIIYRLDKKASLKEKTYISYEGGEASPRAKAQERILDYLKREGTTELKQLLLETKTSRPSLNKLIEGGQVSTKKVREYRKTLPKKIKSYSKLSLNEEQKRAYDQVLLGKELKFLLQGVTGSGKTELYLQLAEECLKRGKSVITLVPEISLTPQTIDRFSGRFGSSIAILHSRLSLSERFDEWSRIKSGQARIVVGARSAIFAPIKNLGLIIIDEAHEKSYISESMPYYNAIEIAEFRSDYNKAPMILGTATPDIRIRARADAGEYRLLKLDKRAGKSKLPKTQIVDMREELKRDNYSMLSLPLQEGIEDALKKNEQVLLFLNKRGHTSYVFCRKCGYIVKCQACDVTLTYHKAQDRLVCHYCGRTKKMPSLCPNCRSKAIKEYGAGTEKLEEEVKRLFPNARVLRADADTTSKKGDYEKIYQKMKGGEVDILLGTQMIAKGLDFPNVSLVGIVLADLSLNSPDYTAQERTFQLITQVSGRAGRSDLDGRVVIQTYQPGHFAIQAAANNDFESFYEKELEIRKRFNYPPYTDILLIRVEHEKKAACREFSRKVLEWIKERLDPDMAKDSYITGPNPAVIQRINNIYRYNIIIRTKDHLDDYRRLLKDLKKIKIDRETRLKIIIDPVSLY